MTEDMLHFIKQKDHGPHHSSEQFLVTFYLAVHVSAISILNFEPVKNVKRLETD